MAAAGSVVAAETEVVVDLVAAAGSVVAADSVQVAEVGSVVGKETGTPFRRTPCSMPLSLLCTLRSTVIPHRTRTGTAWYAYP